MHGYTMCAHAAQKVTVTNTNNRYGKALVWPYISVEYPVLRTYWVEGRAIQ